MMFTFLGRGVYTKPHKNGQLETWKYYTILISDVLDIIFAVKIFVSSKLLLEEYNDERRRVIAAMANKGLDTPNQLN